jgi:hypothetical protein
MKLLMLTTLATLALADEPQYPVPIIPRQQHWPTLYGENFAATCYGCRTKRSAEADPEAQFLATVPLIHHPLSPNAQVPKSALPAPPAALPVVPTYLHGVHTVASALDLKNSVPVPVGAPAPKYPGVVVPKIPAGPVFPKAAAVSVAPIAPAAPVISAVPLPAYPAVLPVAPAAPVVVTPEEVAPVKVGAAVHPEGVLGHVARSPQGLSDFTTLNLAGTHIPVLSAGLPVEAPEAPAAPAETRRKRSAQNDFYENFFALHGEYPKAFVTGPGIYGVGNSGISTVYDVRSSPMGAIGR